MPPGAGPPSGTMAWMNLEWVRTGVEPNRPNACVAPAAARFNGPEQVASGQSLSGCEAPIPITIQGRVQSANLTSTLVDTAGGKCKSGSVDGNGIFISTIKARSQSIG